MQTQQNVTTDYKNIREEKLNISWEQAKQIALRPGYTINISINIVFIRNL